VVIKIKKEKNMLDFIKARLGERTSLDGGVLIAICGSIILFGGVVKLAAWAGLGWGIWTLIKKEG
jgi:ABC-type phosphate transport system permease subunit